MRLVTFGRDDQDRLVICFPIFIKNFNKEPMTLHQIETVKVPIVNTNQKADSYTEGCNYKAIHSHQQRILHPAGTS